MRHIEIQMVARMDDHIISVSRDCVNGTGHIVIINFVGKNIHTSGKLCYLHNYFISTHLPVTTTFFVAVLTDSGEFTTDWQVYWPA